MTCSSSPVVRLRKTSSRLADSRASSSSVQRLSTAARKIGLRRSLAPPASIANACDPSSPAIASQRATPGQAGQPVADGVLGDAVRFDHHAVAAAALARAQLVRRAVGDQLAAADDDDAAAGRLHLGEDVRRQDDRLLAADLLDERPDLDDLVGVEAARRLVEDDDVRVVQHRLRQARRAGGSPSTARRPACRRRRPGRSARRSP